MNPAIQNHKYEVSLICLITSSGEISFMVSFFDDIIVTFLPRGRHTTGLVGPKSTNDGIPHKAAR